VLADSFSKLYRTEAVSVMGVSVVECLAGGFLDALGCIEIWLAHFQMDDVHSRSFHLVGLFEHVHDDEGGHAIEAFRKTHLSVVSRHI
jgi:hypothetical protein